MASRSSRPKDGAAATFAPSPDGQRVRESDDSSLNAEVLTALVCCLAPILSAVPTGSARCGSGAGG